MLVALNVVAIILSLWASFAVAEGAGIMWRHFFYYGDFPRWAYKSYALFLLLFPHVLLFDSIILAVIVCINGAIGIYLAYNYK